MSRTSSYLFSMLIGMLSIHNASAADGQAPDFPLIAGRNAINFNDPQYDSAYVGMGFVLSHQGKYYAVTAKHVLFAVAHPRVTHIDPRAELKSWTMTSTGPASSLSFGEMLNADPNEPLDMQVLKRDALLFAVDGTGPFTAITLSAQPPQAGEKLYALGCTFATEQTCTQDVYAGEFLSADADNLYIDLGETKLDSLRGLSGGPVLNAQGELVGIVSNALPDASGKERFAPATLTYLKSALQAVDQLESGATEAVAETSKRGS